MLVLFESPSGYAIFKVLDESKVQAAEDMYEHFETAEKASNMLKLKHFKKFEDTTEALAATTAAIEGKLSKPLKKLLKKVIAKDAHEKLAVADAKLGQAIKEKLDLPCIYSPAVQELMRGIRAHINSLITGLPEKDMTAMALGLAHSLSRYKLKFSPDKVDTMIIQAISLLDDLDKELNNYIMRCREWYGWHFPEMGKVISDHIAYAKTIKLMGLRTNALDTDFSEILPEEIEQQVKDQAQISMGTEISAEDIINIQYLADQIIEISNYREQLYDYLKNRMMAIAPNLTILVGEMVGARLVAHAGSLLNLAKHPASTVQILGAEKALFRALKTRKQTPKYGLIYHASMVGQTNAKNKGKIARVLAAKCSLAVRYDALADETSTEMGVENRAKLEKRLMFLEQGGSSRLTVKQEKRNDKWHNKGEVITYDVSQDSTLPVPKKRKAIKEEDEVEETPTQPRKKKIKTEEGPPEAIPIVMEDAAAAEETPKKKKKKKIKTQDETAEATPVCVLQIAMEDAAATEETPKKKKKKKIKTEDETAESTPIVTEDAATEETPKKKKKKRKTDQAPAEVKQEAGDTVEQTKIVKKKKKKKVKQEESEK